MSRLGELIKEFRKRNGVTQTELATELGCSHATIVNLEKNCPRRYQIFYELIIKMLLDKRTPSTTKDDIQLPEWFCKCGCNGTNGDMFYDHVKKKYHREPTPTDWAIFWKSRFWAACDGLQYNSIKDGDFNNWELGGDDEQKIQSRGTVKYERINHLRAN